MDERTFLGQTYNWPVKPIKGIIPEEWGLQKIPEATTPAPAPAPAPAPPPTQQQYWSQVQPVPQQQQPPPPPVSVQIVEEPAAGPGISIEGISILGLVLLGIGGLVYAS